MKSLIFAPIWTLMLLLLSSSLLAQTTSFTMGNETGFPGDTVKLPISVDQFNAISGYQGTIRWDSTVLNFIEMTSPTPGITNIFGNPGQGLIPLNAATFTWVNFSGSGTTLPTGSAIIEISFQIKAAAPLGITPVQMDSSVTDLAYSDGLSLYAPAITQGSVTVSNCIPTSDPGFTFPSSVCQNGNNPLANITGDSGGIFSVNQGANIDPITGELDLSSTTGGTTYMITYGVGAPCMAFATQSIQVLAMDDATFSIVDSVCIGSTNPAANILGLNGGLFSVDNGASIDPLSGELDLNTTLPSNSYMITYQTQSPCPNASIQTIFIADSGDASFSYPAELCPGSPNPIANLLGDAGGSFSVSPAATIDPLTGELDLSSTQSGVVYTITYSLNNFCQAIAQQQIVISDSIAPVSIALPSIIAECMATVPVPSTMDNCAGMIMGTTNDPLTYSAQGNYSVNWTFDDGNGNQTIQSQMVIVKDSTAPTVVCQNISVQLNANGMATITPAQIDNGSTDACGLVSLVVSQDSFSTADVGPNQISLIATDVNGNIDSCIAVVTVIGLAPPTAVCQDFTVYLDAAGIGTIQATDLDGGSTVSFGLPQFSISQDSFDCGHVGLNQVQLYVSDDNGAADSCMALVTVVDSIAPTPILQDQTLYLDASGQAQLDAANFDLASFDNCGLQSFSVDVDQFDCGHVGANPVLVTLTDVHGNSQSAMEMVFVEDTIAPMVICQDISIMLDSTGQAIIDAAMIDAGSSDACGIQSMSLSQDTFTVDDLGMQTVQLTIVDNNGNSSTCSATVSVSGTTSIEKVSYLLALRAYPNPVEDRLQLELDSPLHGEVSIEVMNAWGQIVHQQTVNKHGSYLQVGIECKDIATGVYIVRVRQDAHTQYTRVIKK